MRFGRVVLACVAMGVCGLFLALPGEVSAQWGHDHSHSFYGGYDRGYGGHGYGGLRSFGYRGCGPSYHDTSHWDYHPGYHWRHGNHFHYEPGHYDWHQTGHWH